MDAYLDPFDGEGLLKDQEIMSRDSESVCEECGEEWEGESCFGYVSEVCTTCGALADQSKIPEEEYAAESE